MKHLLAAINNPIAGVIGLLFWAGLLSLSGCSLFTQPKPPNILIILVDDLGMGDVTCYGATDMLTPNLDQLAQEGVMFTNFYAASPVCSPTRAALLSGRNPYEVGVPGVIRANKTDSWGFLDTSIILLPNWLQAQGYYTGLVGKWNLGLEPPNLPNGRGFEYFAGFLTDKMDDCYTHLREGNNYMRINGEPVEPKGHATEVFTNWACQFIDQSSRQERPFFLYLAYTAPHNPIQPPQEWINNYKNKFPQTPEKRALYGAFVAHLDHQIGIVLQMLKQKGLDQNTLVIFTSDNGAALHHGGSNGTYNSGKPTMYEGGLKVPMLVKYPPQLPRNNQTNRLAITTDIMPSVCQMLSQANQPCPTTNGVGFWEAITNPAAARPLPRQIYWTVRDADGIFGSGNTLEALRVGDIKIMRTLPDSLPEMYNLATDSAETNNLAYADTLLYGKMRQLLDSIERKVNALPYRK